MNYEEMSLAELKELAKSRNIKGVSLKKKQEIIEVLTADDKFTAEQNNEAEAKQTITPEKNREESVIPRERLRAPERPLDRPAERPVMRDRPMQERQMQERQMQDRPMQERQIQERPMQERQMRERPMQERQMRERPMQERQMQDRPMQERQMQDRPMQERQMQDRFGSRERSASDNSSMLNGNEQNENEAVQRRFEPQGGYSAEQIAELDSGIEKNGVLEIMPDGFGFIRCDNFLPGDHDVYVSPMQIRRWGLRTGDIICGNTKKQGVGEKFSALLYIKNINGYTTEETLKRKKFENLTPIFPHDRIRLEVPGSSVAMRMVDLIAPIGKGQRGMIVSQPKSGKTTLLKEIANSITKNHPDMHLIILLIDERPEEVTDMKESIHGEKVEVIYSTFDELPEKHKRVSEMVIERAKRLVEYGNDVCILLDSITRLARAYNLTVQSTGRTLSGGLDPAALHMPKRFFGAARTMREGGSLTILATALVETGSRMDDVVFEEFKGTGNMELVLDRNLSERRIFPAVDLAKSGTRRDDLLLSPDESEAMALVRKALNGAHPEDATETLINMCAHTKTKNEFVNTIIKGLK